MEQKRDENSVNLSFKFVQFCEISKVKKKISIFFYSLSSPEAVYQPVNSKGTAT